MKFQLLIKSKMLKYRLLAFRLSNVVFIMLISVKMPSIANNFMLIMDFFLIASRLKKCHNCSCVCKKTVIWQYVSLR